MPALRPAILPADVASDMKLSRKLASLSLKPVAGRPVSPIAAQVAGRRYVFEVNPQHIEAVMLTPGPGGSETRLTLRMNGVDQTCVCGNGGWVKGTFTGPSGDPIAVALSGAWSSDDTFSINVVRYRTPLSTAYDLRFSGDTVILEALDHVGFHPERIRLEGRASRS